MATDKNKGELYFEWWLNDMKKVGLVLDYVREPKTFILKDPIQIWMNKKFVRKESFIVSKELFHHITYTPDYLVRFNKKLFNKFIGAIEIEYKDIENEKDDFFILNEDGFDGPGIIYDETMFYTTALLKRHFKEEEGFIGVLFDVKPPPLALKFSSKTGSSRDFKFNKRLMFDVFGLYVNKVVPIGSGNNSLFNKTFFPDRYRYTDSGDRVRKSKGKNAYKPFDIQDWMKKKGLSM